jgi:hypothetical protein
MKLLNRIITGTKVGLQNYATLQYQNAGRAFRQIPTNLTRQDVVNHPLYNAIPEHSQTTILPPQNYQFSKREVFSLAFSQIAIKSWGQEQYRKQNKDNTSIQHPSYRKIFKQELSSVFQNGFQAYARQTHRNVVYNALNQPNANNNTNINSTDVKIENNGLGNLNNNTRHFNGTEIKSLLSLNFASELWKTAQLSKNNQQNYLHNPYEYNFNNLRV